MKIELRTTVDVKVLQIENKGVWVEVENQAIFVEPTDVLSVGVGFDNVRFDQNKVTVEHRKISGLG